MSTSPKEQPETPEISAGSTEPGPGNWENDSLRDDREQEQGQEEVDPDDENANLDPTGSGEADVDPDDDSAEDYPQTPSEQAGA